MRRFGRTPAQSVRAAVLLALLGGATVVGLGRLLTAPRGPLGPAYAATGLPDWLIPAVGGLCVAAIAAAGLVRSLRESPRFEARPDGLHVQGSLGAYLVHWNNVDAAEATPTGALGLRLRDRQALLVTHVGTPRQREWLATMEPIGGWDLLFASADLGHPAETVRKWIVLYLEG